MVSRDIVLVDGLHCYYASLFWVRYFVKHFLPKSRLVDPQFRQRFESLQGYEIPSLGFKYVVYHQVPFNCRL